MSQRLLLALLTALAAGLPTRASALPQIPPHNVVVLLADDAGVDLVGAYERFYRGHPQPGYENTTPAIDYLASTGLTFRNAWTNPVCSPTRAQILTGRPGMYSGIGKTIGNQIFAVPLSLDLDTLPSILRNPLGPGYTSAAVGKWHLAPQADFSTPSGLFHALGDANHRWFDAYAGTAENLAGQSYNNWDKLFATRIQGPADECLPPVNDYCIAPVTDYATVDTADDAIHLIRTLPEPFFLYVAFNAPHAPLEAPAVPLTGSSCVGAGGVIQGEPNCPFPADSPGQARCLMQWMDNEIGRILCALEADAQQPDQPTTIVFLGDNGTSDFATVAPFVPEHGKGSLYDGGVHVPFIVKSPLVDAALVGRTTDALVCATDLLATVAEIAGVPLPPDPHGLRDSVSFGPVLTGQSQGERRFLYAEKFRLNFVPDAQGQPPPGYRLGLHQRAIRDREGHKLIQVVSLEGGVPRIVEEFYQVKVDPHEQVDRMPEVALGDPRYRAPYKALRDQLDRKYPHLVR